MQTQAPNWRKLAFPIGFALLCVLLTLLAFHSFGGSLPMQPKGYRVAVPLPDATNLVQGSGVQISGVKVGRVVSVTRSGSVATAVIELQSRFAPLRTGTRAIVRTKTLLGEGYLQLAPGSATAPAIRDGGRLAAGDVQRTVQLDELLQTFDPAARHSIRRLFAGLSTALSGRSAALNGALGSAAPASSNLATVFDALSHQQRSLRRVFASSAGVLSALGERQGELQAAVTSGNAVLDATASRARSLAATVDAFAPFLVQLQRTAGTLSAASGDLNRAVGGMLEVAPRVEPALAQIRDVAPEFRTLFRRLPPTLTAGDRGLPSLARILNAAGPALAKIYPSTRELVPVMQLFAAYRYPSLVDVLANAGAFTNGRMVGPGGKIIARGAGTATVWNESIGGWVKKLPTNRQNPYLKPTGLDELSRGQGAKVYDCRHTGNPLYLPPTGTGAPPCVVQGPWKFNGRSHYYPRLPLAPP